MDSSVCSHDNLITAMKMSELELSAAKWMNLINIVKGKTSEEYILHNDDIMMLLK